MNYGYARVSTSQQDHQSQIEQLKAAGAVKVFSEKISGATTERPQLKRAIDALDEGDVLIFTRIDRLARSTRDLLNIIHEVRGKGAVFRSLAEPWANTDSPTASAMLTILGAVAELERSFILARTQEGIARARENGMKPGPKPKLTEVQLRQVRKMQAEGAGFREIGEVLRCSASTVSRALKRSADSYSSAFTSPFVVEA